MSENPLLPEASPIPLARPANVSLIPYARALLPPIEPPPLAPADAWFDIASAVLALAAGFGVIALLERTGRWNPSPDLAITSQVLWLGAVTLAAVAVLLRRRGQAASAIGLRRTPFGPALGWALLAIPACYVLNIGVGAVYVAISYLRGQSLEHMLAGKVHVFDVIADTPLVLIVPLTFLIGIYEEVLFRGLILARLRDALGSPVAAAIVSSLIFAAFHFAHGLLGMLQAGVIGLVFSFLMLWRRNLWSCILAHFLLDALGFFVAPLLRTLSLPAS